MYLNVKNIIASLLKDESGADAVEGEETGRQDFQTSLREKITEEIKFDLMANKIVDPEHRALAVIELERRREESELSQVKADLADCQKRLHRQKWVIYAAAVGVVAAVVGAIVVGAIAAWLG